MAPVSRRIFTPTPPDRPRFTGADAIIVLIILSLLAAGIWLAETAPAEVRGPAISLDVAALPCFRTCSLA
ncbi:MAG: hypothetical protein HXY39_18670 [Chloroflexi bacterium]|nr:hypothetical protein [Chloroflexota bacterium]